MDTKDKIENLEGEVWKDVVGYEGLYQVSNKGRVLSLSYMRTKKTRILKTYYDKYGYKHVVLCKNGKTRNFLVHRLVATTFIGNIPPDLVVNHINEDKKDNRLSNLNILTVAENVNWGTRTERASNNNRKTVYQYTLNWKLVKVWPSLKACGESGFSISCISACCLGKIKYHKRFVWRYKEEIDANKTPIRHRNKPVAQCDKNGNIIQTWESVHQTKYSGFNDAAVHACCSGKRTQHKGYIWKFI